MLRKLLSGEIRRHGDLILNDHQTNMYDMSVAVFLLDVADNKTYYAKYYTGWNDKDHVDCIEIDEKSAILPDTHKGIMR